MFCLLDVRTQLSFRLSHSSNEQSENNQVQFKNFSSHLIFSEIWVTKIYLWSSQLTQFITSLSYDMNYRYLPGLLLIYKKKFPSTLSGFRILSFFMNCSPLT